MSIYTFKPTYLYIKQHSLTGKLYFGKTTRNPETYLGSGIRWKRHIKEHGKEHVVTLWYCLFLDQESCTEFASMYSKQENIVESTNWLNLQEENGMDGHPPGVDNPNFTFKGRHHKPETLEKLASWIRTDELKHKIGASREGQSISNEHKLKISNYQKGRPKEYRQTKVNAYNLKTGQYELIPKEIFENTKNTLFVGINSNLIPKTRRRKKYKRTTVICPHCNKSGSSSNMRRYHFDNCKLKSSSTLAQ